MEDHGRHHPSGATLAYALDYELGAAFDDEHAGGAGAAQQADYLAFSTAAELRRALVRSLAELDAARAAHQAELRRVEAEAARLAALVASAAAERDELRRHCHSLLLLLHHQQQAQQETTPAPPTLAPRLISGGGVQPAAGVGVGHPAAGGIMEHRHHAPEDAAGDTELETALARRLPEKGRLVEAVVSAGPLLQTLLLAGPLPRWRHPPPPAPADIPPFNPGRLSPMNTDASNSFSSGSAGSSSPESNCSGGAQPLPPVAQHALPPFHMSPFCM